MCTSIVEIAAAEGMAKREDEWFPLTHAVVAYDHARHALLADVITLDFINSDLPPGARAGVELTLDAAKALNAALARAIAAAEIEEADRLQGLEQARLGAPVPARRCPHRCVASGPSGAPAREWVVAFAQLEADRHARQVEGGAQAVDEIAQVGLGQGFGARAEARRTSAAASRAGS